MMEYDRIEQTISFLIERISQQPYAFSAIETDGRLLYNKKDCRDGCLQMAPETGGEARREARQTTWT
ncbi:hypothetical protein [Chordicoccus furentiruminis]|uniref:hypothetical protein n=1 Tax=Chordicoccus furentiruminis TaxID=2709410 RepID=UPI0023A7C713|nr:hypothetical protein [Chordicoccus furentiruminis]